MAVSAASKVMASACTPVATLLAKMLERMAEIPRTETMSNMSRDTSSTAPLCLYGALQFILDSLRVVIANVHRCGKYAANAVVSRGNYLLVQHMVDGAAAGDLIQLLTGEQYAEADRNQYRGVTRAGCTFIEHSGAGIDVPRNTQAVVAHGIEAVLHLKTLHLVQKLYGPGGKV